MNSLFVQGIYITPSTLVTGDDVLWEKKKRKMSRLCCYNENSRNLTYELELTSHMNESATLASTMPQKVHFPSLSIKELAPYKQRKEESRSREVVNPDGFGVGIVPFLKGKVFLITGATGFLAKVLIEKILRTVPDVDKIYLLIKAKDKNEAMERLTKEIVDTELFMHMRQFYGKSYKEFMLKKLIPIVGNVSESGLGMEVGFADHIANEVDIIVHSAGNTTFDERYDVAIDINTLGPCRMLSFAKRCKGLKLFMHVSTAYTNGKRRGVISEKPFHNGDSITITRERAGLQSPIMRSFPVLEVEDQIKMALDARDAFVDDNIVTQKMKDFGMERARKYGWQDTYVFTKAMGEMMIESQRNEIPVVIIRPSIIESTYKEPIPGWIEGVPADMVVNAMITAMAKHGAVKKPGLSIYHIASSVANPMTYQKLFDYFFEYFDSSPYMDLQRKPINIQRAKFFKNMDDFHIHIHTEAVQRSTHSPQGVNFSKRLQRSLDYAKQLANLYEPYTFYEGRFDNTNVQKLMQQLSIEEKKSFDFDVRSVDWKDYICNIHIPGLLRHRKGVSDTGATGFLAKGTELILWINWYDVAIDINTLGPCRMLSFAKRCKGLKLFMHLSTAYTNGQRKGVILEKAFHNGDSITRELAALENSMRSFPVLEVEAEIYMALDARDAFHDNIVTQKMKDLGLERAKMMMDPLLIYYGKGELTAFPVDAKGVIDAQWQNMEQLENLDCALYQIASSVVNPLVYQDLCDYFFEYFGSSPYMDLQRRPIKIQRAKVFNSMDDFHTHVHTEAVQKESKFSTRIKRLKETPKIIRFCKTVGQPYLYEPYTFYEGRFDNTNVQMLMKELSQEETRCFDFDVGSVDWKDYICNIHIPGLLRHVQKGRGNVFLITGATGFLAKVLVEKILRTVPDVGKIYLLIRAKDKDVAMERLKKEILDTELFRCMGQSYDKLVPVVGNVCETNIGMEAGLADHIANEVEIIVHSAGDTSFDERYDVALNVNTLGPCRVLNIAKRCTKLKLFMHVSTAYVNGCRQGVVSEKPFYLGDSIAREKASLESPGRSFPILDVEAEIKMAFDARDAFQDNMVTQKLKDLGIGRAKMFEWQNTYTFTKAMEEMMIESKRKEIPVVIIRPSIIESTYNEPMPGWVEGIRMMDLIVISYGKGELTGFPVDTKGAIDVVPADIVVNAMLAAMVKHGAVQRPGLDVYHIASSVVNLLLYGDLINYMFEYFDSCPYTNVNGRPINIKRMKVFNSMDDFFSHIQTEAVQRSANSLQGKVLSRRLQRSLDIMKHLADLYEPYTFYGGRFDNTIHKS
ncbi:Fatty acyl-coa reductase [Thalictrum thalictroides]|uniref:Fatty acyl-CoA reductase n=1 Tax=Thalictrum thalictroides TaxID=46969 RepID=A0A7J6XFR5_THATH|nr:Fatty acyl-coa reductase [Thalictrum thalictroides]